MFMLLATLLIPAHSAAGPLPIPMGLVGIPSLAARETAVRLSTQGAPSGTEGGGALTAREQVDAARWMGSGPRLPTLTPLMTEGSALRPWGHLQGTASPTEPDARREEPQLIEYSDAYLTRLKIHKYASYATLPLFAAAYVTGNELIKKGEHAPSWARNTHGTIAGALGALFAVNTVTGLWNLYESRNDPEGRTRRILHSVLLLAADAGFLATAAMAGESEGGEGGREWGDGDDNSAHRAMAITSMGLAFTGYMTMTWPFRRE